jgi:hypothetical protein
MQSTIVILLVTLSAIYLVRQGWLVVRRKSGGCGSCGSCPSETAGEKPFVAVDALLDPRK